MKYLISVLCAIFVFVAPVIACETNEIDIGSNCVESKFSVTTSETDVFKFTMTAQGTFYVDCGNGGTLTSSSDDISGKTITRTNTTVATYTCNWDSPSAQTIRFAGLATGYSSSGNDGCIVFGTHTPNNSVLRPDLITNISGSLGEIFKSYGRNDTKYPSFFAVFANANALTSLPSDLFSGVNTASFSYAFKDCSNLIEIPENLFSDLSGQPANGAFSYTFHNCVRLQNIPENLFKSVPYLSYGIFYGTFVHCTALKNIPSGLFSHIKDSTSVTTNGNAFYATFTECYGLTSLPENLFASVTRAESGIFAGTFRFCLKITGYVPTSMFRGLIENGSGNLGSAWSYVFDGTGLDKNCPSGTTQYITGYEDFWNERVSCYDPTPQTCVAGEYLPQYYDSCVECPAGKYCTGGIYSFDASANQGIESCATGYSSGAGASVCTANTINITWDNADQSDIDANNAGSVTYDGDIRTPKRAQHINGKIFTGWTFN